MNYYRHNLDPIAFWWGDFALTWYWLNYVASFVAIAAILITWGPALQKSLSKNDIIDHLIVSWFGALIGGRLGYVFFYHPEPFFNEPSLIYKFWLGGMAFHGALIGYSGANLLLARAKAQPPFSFLDLASLFAPLGLFTGRICNFINGELWGRPSELPWAVIFPAAGPTPRHPSQLYEALGEGILLFAFLWLNKSKLKNPGQLSALFLIGYGAIRFVLEFFREPDAQLGYILGALSLGQILSVMSLLVGLLLYYFFCRKKS